MGSTMPEQYEYTTGGAFAPSSILMQTKKDAHVARHILVDAPSQWAFIGDAAGNQVSRQRPRRHPRSSPGMAELRIRSTSVRVQVVNL